jgi:hypothetical protein
MLHFIKPGPNAARATPDRLRSFGHPYSLPNQLIARIGCPWGTPNQRGRTSRYQGARQYQVTSGNTAPLSRRRHAASHTANISTTRESLILAPYHHDDLLIVGYSLRSRIRHLFLCDIAPKPSVSNPVTPPRHSQTLAPEYNTDAEKGQFTESVAFTSYSLQPPI